MDAINKFIINAVDTENKERLVSLVRKLGAMIQTNKKILALLQDLEDEWLVEEIEDYNNFVLRTRRKTVFWYSKQLGGSKE